MPFEFIDNSLIDRRARKRIRSHVMKQKNVGKTRAPRPKPPKTSVRTTLPMLVKRLAVHTQSSLQSPSPQIGNEMSLCPFPGEMTPRCRDLVYKCKSWLFATKISHTNIQPVILNIGEAINQSTLCCQAVDVSASIWIQYIFQDKACTLIHFPLRSYSNCT